MRINPESVKQDEPVTLQEKIPAAKWDMDGLDVEFIGDIDVVCTFQRIQTEILVDTEVKLQKRIVCARCRETSLQPAKYRFKNSYNIRALGEWLDIDEDIREEILLRFPMKVLCVPECKGLCPECGQNLNTGDCKC